MQKHLSSLLTMPTAALAVFIASVTSLGFAFIMQFVFGLDPCILCLWQRVPFALAAVLALGALFLKPYGTRTSVVFALITLCFAVGAGLAIFHTGVEQHWWLGTDGCAIKPLDSMSVEDLRTKLLGTTTAHCDEISWTMLGFSMANWNVPWSLALAGFALAVTCRYKNHGK